MRGHKMRHKKTVSVLFSLIFVLFPLMLMGIGSLFFFHIRGFSVSKIRSNIPLNDYWDVDPLTKSQHELLVKHVFPQTYYYLSNGPNNYAFVSEDKQYVIKFFKKNRLSPRGWLKRYPFSFLRYFGYEVPSDDSFLSEHLFANYKAVYESLRRETGLVYMHLTKRKEFHHLLKLIDRNGRMHKVNLDHFEFVVQSRGDLIFNKIEYLIQKREFTTLRNAIRSFLRLIAVRCEKGFASAPVSLSHHFGFQGDQPIQFDCGIITKDVSMKYPLNIQKEVLQAAEKLNLWFNENHPDLRCLLQEEAASVLYHLSSR